MYCQVCGQQLIKKKCGIDGEVPYCPNCNEFRFERFNSAISAIVLNPSKDKILLIQQYRRTDNILIAGYINKISVKIASKVALFNYRATLLNFIGENE